MITSVSGTFYRSVKKTNPDILPLCIDLTNPSPATGFRNTERPSFIERTYVDLVTALALVHHLVLGKNIPLADVADGMALLTKKYLVIEFVPLTDPKAQELIKNKHTHHPYDNEGFENAFAAYFIIEKKQSIPGTGRILYKMEKINKPV